MLTRVPVRLNYANVMSTIAVFGVLAGGGAWAAAKISSKEIARNAVLSKHIKSGNVTSKDLRKPDAYREVGSPGAPEFQGTWDNEFSVNESTAAFFKDPFGIVHLKGIVDGGGDGQTVFTLPGGYRPTKYVIFAGIRNAGVAQVTIGSDGNVVQSSGGNLGGLTLDGITFRAGTG